MAIYINNTEAGMTYGEALRLGYREKETRLQNGYVSRKCDPLQQPVYKAGGYRRGELFVLLPNRDSTMYCYRVYISRPEVTRSWKVYGAYGHRQRESFFSSYDYDFTTPEDGVRRISVSSFDKTGTHDYVIVTITRPTWEQCEAELEGQLSDGIFENSRTGDVVEVTEQ